MTALPVKPGLLLSAAGLYAAAWWALAREGPGIVALGAVAVLAAAAAAYRLAEPRTTRVRWWRLPRLAGFFVWHSLRGGLDVARRAASADMRLAPGFLVVELSLASEEARVLTAIVVSLLPGTLAARLDGTRLTLHALDARQPIEAEVRRLEREIALLLAPLAPVSGAAR